MKKPYSPSKDFTVGVMLLWLVLSALWRPWAETIPKSLVISLLIFNAVIFFVSIKLYSIAKTEFNNNWTFFLLLVSLGGIIHMLSLLGFPVAK